MNDIVITTPDDSVTITTGTPEVVVNAGGLPGPPGPPGPAGPEGGTLIIAIPYNEWPPADPQPNTLYLRLAP